MSQELIEKLRYSYSGQNGEYELYSPLKHSLQVINNYFSTSSTNKLCLVYPAKEFVAQWLSIPLSLISLKLDYNQNIVEILESYRQFKPGDKLLLNNTSVVQWIGVRDLEKNEKTIKVALIRTKGTKGSSSMEISIPFDKIKRLQLTDKKVLSTQDDVLKSLPKKEVLPVDRLLGIETFGNTSYFKKKVCLITKYKSFNDSVERVLINNAEFPNYFQVGKIDENGEVENKSPLLVSNNLSNLAMHLILTDSVSKIVIDGFSSILERKEDFNDIDTKKIPTILVTDLSEIESFEKIGNYEFDFYNFSKETLKLDELNTLSPFNSFNKKLFNYTSFKLHLEVCENEEIERITKLIYSIEKDESVKELVSLKISLIQLTNHISRIAQPISQSEVHLYKKALGKIEALFTANRFYLGGSSKVIEDSISILGSVIDKFAATPSEKYQRLLNLLKTNHYDFILCPKEEEVLSLSQHLKSLDIPYKPSVLCATEVNNSLLKGKPMKALLTGWAKSSNVNRILSGFIFSELTLLFYQFESGYFNSLQNRNKIFSDNIKSTVDMVGIHSGIESKNDFIELYENKSITKIDSNFDICDFELKLDQAQFSKYIVKGNLADSVRAKRVEFKNDKFIYLTDTHGLLVLENFGQASSNSPYIHKNRFEDLHNGDVIAFLKTERELLNKIVSKQTTPAALAETTKWIELWKHLLRNHYKLLNNDFNKLVSQLKERGCDRDQVTIRSWLFDDLRIGPRKDEDLISIAIMTNGTDLYNNIQQVRAAIRQMTSWRMKASDYVVEQLKAKIKSTLSTIHVNSIIDFEDLGEVEILEITEINNSQDNIDIRNVNRLLEKTKL